MTGKSCQALSFCLIMVGIIVVDAHCFEAMRVPFDKQHARVPAMSPGFNITRVSPKIFSPNNDNRNDCVEFEFENPQDEALYGKVYDLRGAAVGEMKKGSRQNSLVWDGRTVSGTVAPPGVYICQIEVTGDGAKIFNHHVILAK